MISSLTGSFRWAQDLIAWMTDALITLPGLLPPNLDLTDPSKFSLPDLLEHLNSTNTVALHLLLSSPTRGLLTALCRRLSHLEYNARRAIYQSTPGFTPPAPLDQGNGINKGQPQISTVSPELRAAYMQILTLTQTTIIRVKTFETFLSSLTSLIKTAYSSHTPPLSGSPTAEKARNAVEIKMLFCGTIPEAFKSVIVEIFSGIDRHGSYGGSDRDTASMGLLAAVREEIEPAKLFFANFDMLEVDEEPDSIRRRQRNGMTMDSFRKGWLKNPSKRAGTAPAQLDGAGGLTPATGREGARWRRCARCAAAMEDVISERQALHWLVMQQRRCFCGGHWNTLAPGKTVA